MVEVLREVVEWVAVLDRVTAGVFEVVEGERVVEAVC